MNRGKTESLSRDSMQQLLLKALSFYEKGQKESTLKTLRPVKAFQQLPVEYTFKLLEEILRLRLAARPDTYGELADRTRDMASGRMRVPEWLDLFHLALRNGALETASVARQKAIERAFSDITREPSPPDPAIDRAFRAALDQGQFDRARQLLERLWGTAYLSRRKTTEYKCCYLLCAGERERAAESAESLHNYSVPYRKYLEGRSVAVVGPAASEEEHGDEIDRFDVVVRMNHGSDSIISEPEKYGSRTDVSYYNLEYLNHMKGHGNYGFIEKLDFAVFKPSASRIPAELNRNERCRRPTGNLCYFSGFPNLGQLLVADLLLYRPARVKLFYMNFYMARESYHDSYFPSHEFEGENLLRSFAHHDCLSQFHFTRHLCNAGLLEADPVCRRVLEMDSRQYLEGLEEIYVKGAP